MTYLQIIKLLRTLGYAEHRYYPGTNSEMWTDGNKFVHLQIRDGYTKRQIYSILSEGINEQA